MICRKIINIFPRRKTEKYEDGTVTWRNLALKVSQNIIIEKLAPRELQVFILSGRGKTPVEIGIILGISDRTVTSYRGSILEKLEMENQYQVMAYCIRADMDRDEFMDKWLPNEKKESGGEYR